MSATTSEAVEALQQLVLHNPITLNLLSEGAQGGQEAQGLKEGSGEAQPCTHAAARLKGCVGSPGYHTVQVTAWKRGEPLAANTAATTTAITTANTTANTTTFVCCSRGA